MNRRTIQLIAAAMIACPVAAPAAAAAPSSAFTTTDPKKVEILEDSSLDPNTEIDSFRHLCPGFGGYEVIHEGGDLRSWLNLRFKGRTTDLMSDTLDRCRGQFPSKANNVVQWRGFRTAKGFVPYAIIYRMASSAEDAKAGRMEDFIIIKLDGSKSRVAGSLPAKEGNAKAEALADRLCRPN